MRARRHQSIRSRLTALLIVPLVSLVALWILSVALTSGEVVQYLGGQTAQDEYGAPAVQLITELQNERKLSVQFAGSNRSSSGQQQIVAQRAKTDTAVRNFNARTDQGQGGFLVPKAVKDPTVLAVGNFPSLESIRGNVDSLVQRPKVMQDYGNLINDQFKILDQVASVGDSTTVVTAKNLVTLLRAREQLSQEDALISGALISAPLSGAEFAAFAQNVGAHRILYAAAVAQLPIADQKSWDQVIAIPQWGELANSETQILTGSRPGQAITAVTYGGWQARITAVAKAIDDWQAAVSAKAAGQTNGATVQAFVLLGVAAVVGLIAIVVSLVFSVRVSRRLIRQLRRLGGSAQDMATKQLPAVVERLRAGEKVDADIEAPALEYGSDEIGQVGDSFNAVRHTAVRVAVEQANLRAGVNTVFVNIARRTQGLVHQQLSQLDAMERKATDPADLDDLFKIDNLATRMRRNAENLIILGGGAPGRQWRQPVPLVDVIRSAAAEVGGYSRVRVLPIGEGALNGSAVSDVTHLLSELIDNAVSFSPPHTQVQVTGQLVPKGFVVEIEDRGLGMQPDEMSSANRYFSNPPEFNVLAISDNSRLGMFVVARLAARHNVHVSLRSSPYGGTCAIVLIPSNLVSTGAEKLPPAEPKALVGAATGGRGELESGQSGGAVNGYDSGPATNAPSPEPPPASVSSVSEGFESRGSDSAAGYGPGDSRITGGTINESFETRPEEYERGDDRITGGIIADTLGSRDEASEYEDAYASAAEAEHAAPPAAPDYPPPAAPDYPPPVEYQGPQGVDPESPPAYQPVYPPAEQPPAYPPEPARAQSVERAEFIPFVRADEPAGDDLPERRSGGAHRMQPPGGPPLSAVPPTSAPPSAPFSAPPYSAPPFSAPPFSAPPFSAPPSSAPPSGAPPFGSLPSGPPTLLPVPSASAAPPHAPPPPLPPQQPAQPRLLTPQAPPQPPPPPGPPQQPPTQQLPQRNPEQPPVPASSAPASGPPVRQPGMPAGVQLGAPDYPHPNQPITSAPRTPPGSQPTGPQPVQPGARPVAGPGPLATGPMRSVPPLPPIATPGPASRGDQRGPQLGDHRGLPRRIRQASLSPQLAEVVPPAQEPDGPPLEHRAPDDARRLLSAYQQGSWRGRSAPADWSAQSPLGYSPPPRDDATQDHSGGYAPNGDRGADG